MQKLITTLNMDDNYRLGIIQNRIIQSLCTQDKATFSILLKGGELLVEGTIVITPDNHIEFLQVNPESDAAIAGELLTGLVQWYELNSINVVDTTWMGVAS